MAGDDVRTRARRALRRAARGPVRTTVRRVQARSPLLAQGRHAGPPDFVGIGVQRAGTSWWHGILETHPLIDPLGWSAKELHFFDDRWAADFTDADAEVYAAHFLRQPGHLSGEWTPRYLFDPWAVPLLLRAAPKARLLVMLRDPLDRFRSGLAHAHERLGGVTADVVSDAVERGRYGRQLTRLFDTVDREQVLVLQFEQCRNEVTLWAERTFAFLGLDPVEIPDQRRGGSNASATPMQLPAWLVEELVADYRSDVQALAQLLPDAVDLTLWRNFADLA